VAYNSSTMARTNDTSLLEAALVGYQAEAERISAAIADLQKRLGKRGGGGNTPGPFPKVPTTRKAHRMSAEGRARIAEAQRKRWAAARKKQ
jgi:hypothetical protein